MAMYAKDGSRHHSASRARMHDEMATNKGPAAGVKQMKGQAEGASGPAHSSHPAPTETSIEDHVSEHGPAHGMHYEHDQATGQHHVSTFHGDAKMGDMDHPHTHHSVHKSEAGAHEHMGKSLGMDHADESPDETADESETADSMQDQTAGPRAIPGLS
jgi:hypothetical protein